MNPNEEYEYILKQYKELSLRLGSAPKRKIGNFGKTLLPGDKGFVENKSYPWSLEQFAAGYPQGNINLEIHGFVVLDRRNSPHIMIFKNAQIHMVDGFIPPLSEPPVPFESFKEASMFIEKMHLSHEQSGYVEVSALAPDPGPGMPKPDTLFFDSKKELDKF